MNWTSKKTLTIIVSILALFFISIFITNWLVKNKIEKAIAQLPQHIQLNYESLKVSSLFGNIDIVKPTLAIKGRLTDSVNLNVKLDKLTLSDIGYWDFLVNDKISMELLDLKQPSITYYYNEHAKPDTYRSSLKNKLTKAITIENFKIFDGAITVIDAVNDSVVLTTHNVYFNMNGITMDKNSANDHVPYHYDTFNLQLKDFTYALNEYDKLTSDEIEITKTNTVLKGLGIQTKHNKQELSQILSVERDHFDVVADSVVIKNQIFGYPRDSIFQFTAQNATIYQPIAKLYRDKLLPDDTRIKPLYNKMLRDLNFDLMIEHLIIENGLLEYSDRIRSDAKVGTLEFKNLDADIINLGNTYPENETTEINISALFMKNTPFNVNWKFDVNNQNDDFIFQSEIGRLPASEMNTFMEPSLSTRFEGVLNKTYFTIDGNNHMSNVELRVNYDDFKVIVLSDKGKEKNRLLTALVNLFVESDSDDENGNMRIGNKEGVERDQTKSIFNFLWLNTRSGLISAMAGDGKKD